MPLTRTDEEIRIFDNATGKQGSFDPDTGVKLWGNLEMEPDEVLFQAWRQTQPPKKSDVVLRREWKNKQ